MTHDKSHSEVDFAVLLSAASRAAKKEGLSLCDAEDVASLALMHYLEAAQRVKHPVAWVLLVARRKAWHFRRRQRLRVGTDEMRDDAFELASSHFEAMEELLDLKAALSTLEVAERRTVVSRYAEGNRLGAIAESTGVSQTTVQRRLKRGRESLRRALTGRSLRRYLHCADRGRIQARR